VLGHRPEGGVTYYNIFTVSAHLPSSFFLLPSSFYICLKIPVIKSKMVKLLSYYTKELAAILAKQV
jgi:hypothetical protein